MTAAIAPPTMTGRPDEYRRNVGLMLIAPDRRVFVGCRANQPDAWQMPQGGIDKGETPVEAACRELHEEVGTTRALLLRESAGWISYEVPEERRPAYWKGRWRGQAPEVDGSVLIVGGEPRVNAIQNVLITKGHAYDLGGEVVEGGIEASTRDFEERFKSKNG